MILSGLKQLWGRYVELLASRPLSTRCVTAFFLLGSSDVVRQGIELQLHRHTQWDASRTLRMSLWYSVIHAPVYHLWLIMLDRHIGPSQSPRIVAIKVLMDCFIFAPTILGSFIFANSLMQGHSVAEARQSWYPKYVSVMQVAWAYWLPVHVVNYGVIPLAFRLLFVNTAMLVFGVLLSALVNTPKDHGPETVVFKE
eukprot:RCo007737